MQALGFISASVLLLSKAQASLYGESSLNHSCVLSTPQPSLHNLPLTVSRPQHSVLLHWRRPVSSRHMLRRDVWRTCS